MTRLSEIKARLGVTREGLHKRLTKNTEVTFSNSACDDIEWLIEQNTRLREALEEGACCFDADAIASDRKGWKLLAKHSRNEARTLRKALETDQSIDSEGEE